MATTEALLTAEEYLLLPDLGQPNELVRGRIVMMNMPGSRHGLICNRIGAYLLNFVEEHDLGYVLSNDSGVVTERGPDTVRGADVSYFSYQRIPRGALPEGYPSVSPEIVFEVRSQHDRIKPMREKASEYLKAGVLVVCLVDPKAKTIEVHLPNGEPTKLAGDQELTFPVILPRFSLPLARLFS
jgi:Uma2 family endonuclease